MRSSSLEAISAQVRLSARSTLESVSITSLSCSFKPKNPAFENAPGLILFSISRSFVHSSSSEKDFFKLLASSGYRLAFCAACLPLGKVTILPTELTAAGVTKISPVLIRLSGPISVAKTM